MQIIFSLTKKRKEKESYCLSLLNCSWEMMDEMDIQLASDKLFKQNEKGNSLNKKEEKGGPKRNEKE